MTHSVRNGGIQIYLYYIYYNQLLLFCICRNTDDSASQLSPFPTVVCCGDGDGVVYKLFFERRCICHCTSLLSSVISIMAAYFVFDVCYPKELQNTFNFLDVFIGGIDKKSKIRSVVQRKINILHAD